VVFKSILDNDVYKFHMGCIFWDKFRGTPTEYAYTCRDKDINLRPIYRSLCQEIEAMQDVALTKEEQKWLFENTKVTQDYLVNFLSKFKYCSSQVQIKKISSNPGLIIRPTGPVEEASLWEMPLMYIISELYFKNMYGKKFPKIVEAAKTDLNIKISNLDQELHQNPLVNFLFSEFGTRRRLSGEFQDYAVECLDTRCSSNLVGTSNTFFAKKHNIKAVGTQAHEYYQFYQAFYHILDSQKAALKDWSEFYRGWLSIALTDTLGSNQWNRDFSKKFMVDYTGQRHDSADPIVWANKRIEGYEKEGVDFKEKTLLFSDNLTFEKAFKLSQMFCGKINVTHGIGTFITNNIPSVSGHKALNQVIKIVRANGRPVTKLSDDPLKAQCEDEAYLNYVRHAVK